MAQVQHVAAPNEKCVRLLEGGDPTLSLDAGQRREFQHTQRLPPELTQGALRLPADRLASLLAAAGEGVDRGGYKQCAGLGDRLAEEIDQRLVMVGAMRELVRRSPMNVLVAVVRGR